MTVRCSYCLDDLDDDQPQTLDEHLLTCPKYPRRIGLEREGWDVPAEAA